MTDLLLRVRLEALQQNLRQVRNLMDLIQENGNSVRTLYRVLDEPAAPIKIGLTNASMASDALRKLLEEDENFAAALQAYPDALQQLRRLPDNLTTVRKALEAARTEVKLLLGSVQETDALLNRESIQDIFGDTAKNLLMDAVQLQEQLPGRESGKPPQAAVNAHWDKFRELVGNRERLSVFQEYVDVAGGLSLRGNGMDEQFCAMADWLSEHWNRVIGLPYWFSIPARDEARLMTHIIVPVGFPEWTIWAVPLFAHEVGRIFVDKDKTLQDFAAAQARGLPVDTAGTSAGTAKTQARPGRKRVEARQARLRTYLADAFATYVMGPAYACASLLLKLDPSGVGRDDQDRGWDHVRARVILGTLKKIRPEVAAEMADIIKTLEESWQVAVERFAPAESTGHDLALVEPVITKAIDTLRRLEQIRDEPICFNDDAWGHAKRLAAEVFANLHHGADVTRADTAGAKPLRTHAADDVPVPHESAEAASGAAETTGISLPLVLNAAWYQRVTRPDPDTTAAIARRVREEIWPKLRHQEVTGRSGSMSTRKPIGL